MRDGALVGPELWLPSEPFDYGWGMFGCNQLRCAACGQPVRAAVDPALHCRRYSCACQSRDEYGYHQIGADSGTLHEFVTAWQCAGHPRLALPAVLDGVALPAGGPFEPIVERTLAAPPFVAPGFTTASFWVQRLFRLLVDAPEQPQVSRAVAAQLAGSDPRTAVAAMEFLHELPWADGAEHIATVAERDRARLRATRDPTSPIGEMLYDRMLETLEPRLAVRGPGGKPVDGEAIRVARGAALAGECSNLMLYHLAAADPAWFADHAADIARAKPKSLEFVLEALKSLPAADGARAAQAIGAIGKAADKVVRRWLADNPSPAPVDSDGDA
jgi:hypothetical protein